MSMIGQSGPPPKRSRKNFKDQKPKKTVPAKQKQKGGSLSTIARESKSKTQVVAPNVSNQNLKESLAVTALFDEAALNLAFASLYSYFASRGCMSTSIEDSNNANSVPCGLGYAFNALVQDLTNGVINVSRAPRILLDLMAALTAKDVNFMTFSKLNFSWQDAPTFTNYPNINVNTASWTPTIVESDSEQYDSLATFPNLDFSVENYSAFLGIISSLNGSPMLELLDPAKYRSPLARDVSTFARAYVYNGIQPSQAGGYYKDVENEVGITAPMMSSFAKYGDVSKETRVPTKLHAFSGDAAVSVGWPLHSTFVSYFNKRAPSFKLIDFEWICQFYCSWISFAINDAVATGQWQNGAKIGCTFQDFRIVLRQALMNVFDSQYMVQFTAPLEFGTGENGFIPFQVNGSSYGNQLFTGLLAPTLLKENLAALKARSIRNNKPGKSKLNVLTYFPVLGRYVTDVPAVPVYIDPNGGPAVPVFIDLPQSPINLVDGTISPGKYVDLNCVYYQTALSNVNYAIQDLRSFTCETSSIVGDNGLLGLGALFYTAIVRSAKDNTNAGPAPKYIKSKYLDLIANSVTVVPGTKDKKTPKALPPASVITETQCFTTTGLPVNSEMQAMLDSIIVPVMRVDPNGTTDQISLQMYQIEAKEALSSKYEIKANPGGGGVFTRLSKYGGMCVTGIGHDHSSEYQTLIEQLSKHNDGSFLSGLLGGLAKTFLPPDLHGIVDTVADVLPF